MKYKFYLRDTKSPRKLEKLSCLLPGTQSYRGVSKQLPLTQIIGINFAINPFCFSFPSLLLSRTFFATSLAEKVHTLFLPDNEPGNLFSRSFLCPYNFSFFLMSRANYLY
jgi:hypothetical protein